MVILQVEARLVLRVEILIQWRHEREAHGTSPPDFIKSLGGFPSLKTTG